MTTITLSTLEYLEYVGHTLGGAWQRVLLRAIATGVLQDMGWAEDQAEQEIGGKECQKPQETGQLQTLNPQMSLPV